jgi:phage-related protein
MSNTFSLGSIEQKNRIASDTTFLPCIEVEVVDYPNPTIIETLFLVSNNEDRTLGGILYTAFPFRVDFSYEAGSQPTISIIAQDIVRTLQSRMQQYNGAVGFNVRLKIFHQDAENGTPDFQEVFQVLSGSSSDYVVTWTLGSENLLDRQFPGRRQNRSCAWRYKGDECGYNGSLPSCDYSLFGANGCKVHANGINFGGFPGIKNA